MRRHGHIGNNCNGQFFNFLRTKVFFCYALSSSILLVGVYVLVSDHLLSRKKIDNLFADMTELYKELYKLSRKQTISTGDMPSDLSCIETMINNVIEKYTGELQNDILETKIALNQMKSKTKESDVDEKTNLIDSRPNFGSKFLGARIIFIEDEPYPKKNFLLSLFGLQSLSNGPSNILNPSMEPGNCYAFKNKSTIIVKLLTEIFIDSISISHISVNQSPSGNLSSAPKEFMVYGLKSKEDKLGHLLGTFVYNIDLKNTVQTFPTIGPLTQSFQYVKFIFKSNNGHPNFTCVYRIGIYGTPKTNMLN